MLMPAGRRLAWTAVLFLAACATEAVYTQNIRSWVGKPQASLLQDWGEPTRIADSGGTHIITYDVSRKEPGAPPVTATGGSAPVGPLRCETSFFVQDGMITRFAFTGNDCKTK